MILNTRFWNRFRRSATVASVDIQQIRQIQAHIKQTYPRLRVTGASFEAVGLPDCITQGKVAAEEVIAEL